MTALGKLAAGLWLLDQLAQNAVGIGQGPVGMLGEKGVPVPWWEDWPFPIEAEDLRGGLSSMARRSAAEALTEGYREAAAVRDALMAQPAEAAR